MKKKYKYLADKIILILSLIGFIVALIFYVRYKNGDLKIRPYRTIPYIISK